MLKYKSLIGIAFLAWALAAAAPTFLPNNAAAFYSKTVQGGSLEGTLGSGSVTCPDGTTVSHEAASLSVQLNYKTGTLRGFFTISNPFFQNIFIPVNKAEISPNNFKLTGIVSFDTACPSASQPSSASLNGPCQGGTVEYADTSGVRATIPGVYVECTG